MRGRKLPEAQRAACLARWAKPEARARQSAIMRAKWAQAKAEGKPVGRPPKFDDLGGKCQLSIYIASDDHALLVTTAKARKMTMSELVRTYLDHGLELDAPIHKYQDHS